MIADKDILLTGGTDGIGLALAKRLAPSNRLTLIGRRNREDIGLPDGADYVQADLCDNGTVNKLCEELDGRAFDHVIHNAAIGWVGDVGAEPEDIVAKMIAANITAPLAITKALASGLEERRGLVTFIGSTATGKSTPTFALYTATKTALTDAARNLKTEWQGRIDVQVIHPGPTRTAFHAKSGLDEPPMANLFMKADEVAAGIVKALTSRRAAKSFGMATMLAHAAKRSVTGSKSV